MHFFWPSLRCKVIEQMEKSRYLVEFPAQKKEPKWFQILGRFKKNSSCSVAKKSPKNWTGPCLRLNMVRRKRFIKWQTLSRNAKSSFEGTNPTPPSPMQQCRITYCRPPPHTMCPTAFLAPTLTAKTCFICTQPQNAFFLAQLALQGNRANGKKSLPGRVPGPKKGTKMVPNSGSFQEEFLAQWPKKVPKIGPGPALDWTWCAERGSSSGKRYREMPNLRLKVRTQRRRPMHSLPERRSYHVL